MKRAFIILLAVIVLQSCTNPTEPANNFFTFEKNKSVLYRDITITYRGTDNLTGKVDYRVEGITYSALFCAILEEGVFIDMSPSKYRLSIKFVSRDILQCEIVY